jgi:hypothetical protein
MRCWTLLLFLLAAASSLTSAAAAAVAGYRGYCVINNAAIYKIIKDGDQQEALAAALGECWSYTPRLHGDILKEIVLHNRFGSLELFLARMTFPEANPALRDEALTDLLAYAIESGRYFLVERILKERFTIDRCRYRFFAWPQPWNTSRIGDFIRAHPEHAAGLAPTAADFTTIAGETEASLLIDFSRYCAEVAQLAQQPVPESAHPTFLLGGLVWNGLCPDWVIAVTIWRLVKMGGRVVPKHFDAVSIMAAEHRRPIDYTMRVLHSAYYHFLAKSKKE